MGERVIGEDQLSVEIFYRCKKVLDGDVSLRCPPRVAPGIIGYLIHAASVSRMRVDGGEYRATPERPHVEGTRCFYFFFFF